MKNFLIVFSVCFFVALFLPKSFFRKFDRILRETKTIGTSSDSGHKIIADQETTEYFEEVTLKNELNSSVKRSPNKYKTDVKIYMSGNYQQFMLDEVNRVIDDLNNLIDPIDFSIVQDRDESNMVIYFGDYKSFISRNPEMGNISDVKTCDGFFRTKSNRIDGITSSKIFINLPRQDSEMDTKDVIREEITQSLGFYNDSWKYPNSCFYQGSNLVTEYSQMDIKLIKLLYNE